MSNPENVDKEDILDKIERFGNCFDTFLLGVACFLLGALLSVGTAGFMTIKALQPSICKAVCVLEENIAELSDESLEEMLHE